MTQITSNGIRPREGGRKLILRKEKGKSKSVIPWDSNPFFIERQQWYFYGADWIKVYGPYNTVEEVKEAFDKYVDNLR